MARILVQHLRAVDPGAAGIGVGLFRSVLLQRANRDVDLRAGPRRLGLRVAKHGTSQPDGRREQESFVHRCPQSVGDENQRRSIVQLPESVNVTGQNGRPSAVDGLGAEKARIITAP